MEMTEERLKQVLDNFVDKVYTKGDIKFNSRITHNDTWFAHKKDRRATIYNINLEVEVDKLFPLSKNYDPNYTKKLKKAYQIENVKKYLGMDNLVIVIDFEWDSQENQKFLNEVFRPLCMKMTEETINNMVNDKNIQQKTGVSTKEQFQKIFKFAIWDDINDGELLLEVVTHYQAGIYHIRDEVLEHAMRTINKYGLQDLEINNNIGELA